MVNNGSDVTYSPDADYHGPDSFSYTVSDGNGGSDTADESDYITVIKEHRAFLPFVSCP